MLMFVARIELGGFVDEFLRFFSNMIVLPLLQVTSFVRF
jgi:hypothetical protein